MRRMAVAHGGVDRPRMSNRSPTAGFRAAPRLRARSTANRPTAATIRSGKPRADGLFILQLQAALTRAAAGRLPRRRCGRRRRSSRQAGGIFGSINHDTYDPHENVAYSVAFRTLLLAVARA